MEITLSTRLTHHLKILRKDFFCWSLPYKTTHMAAIMPRETSDVNPCFSTFHNGGGIPQAPQELYGENYFDKYSSRYFPFEKNLGKTFWWLFWILIILKNLQNICSLAHTPAIRGCRVTFRRKPYGQIINGDFFV